MIRMVFDPYNGLANFGGNANAAFCLALVYNMPIIDAGGALPIRRSA